MRILNLFAGIGGNRTLWGDKHEITAVESNQQIALIYAKRFPKDTVIIGDAYEYFLTHFHEFDLVWASPPCQSHTILTRSNVGNRYNGKNVKLRFPDSRLYELIQFLISHFRGYWIVENVHIGYKEWIPHTSTIGRHYIWSNLLIPSVKQEGSEIIDGDEACCKVKGIDYEFLKEFNVSTIENGIRTLARNCVKPIFGKHIMNIIENKNKQQQSTLEVFLR